MPRTAVRRAKKKARQMIPGVPSFQEGGSITTPDQIIAGNAGGQGTIDLQNILFQEAINSQQGPGGGDSLGGFQVIDLGFGLVAIVAPDGSVQITNNRSSTGGGGGGIDPRSLDLQSRGLDIQESQGDRGLDLTQRAQDLQNQQFQLQFELDQEIQRRNAAVAEGNLELARQSEARIDRIQTQQNQLQRARLDLDVGTGLGNIASAQGNLELQRQQELARTLANPRDFAQLNLSLGGGQSFLGQALAGQQIGGQNTANVGTQPVLGGLFEQALARLQARPEEALFQEAAGRIRDTQIPQFKGGGKLVVDEPTVAVGILTGQPKFTLGEGGQQEEVKITPKGKGGTPSAKGGVPSFQEGGELFSSPFLNNLLGGTFLPGGFDQKSAGINQAVGQFGTGTRAGDIFRATTAPDKAPAVFFPQGPQDALTEAQKGLGNGFSVEDLVRRSAEVEASGLTRGQVIQKLQKALNPRSFFGLLPSQRDVLDSVVGLLGFEPEDFTESVLRGFPTGPNPSAVAFGSNF